MTMAAENSGLHHRIFFCIIIIILFTLVIIRDFFSKTFKINLTNSKLLNDRVTLQTIFKSYTECMTLTTSTSLL